MAFKVSNNFMEQFKKDMEAKKDTLGTERKKRTSKVSEVKKDIKDIKETEDIKDTEVVEDTKAKKNNNSKKTISSDTEPLVVREIPTKDNGKGYKEFLECSVKRFGENGIPYVHLSIRVESDNYCGYKKGKHISFPLELIYDFIDLINEVDEVVDTAKIE